MLVSQELKDEIVNEVKGLKKQFHDMNGTAPTRIFLTPDIETKIERLDGNDIGPLAGEIFIKGTAREVVTMLCGLKIEGWDSEIAKVE